MQLSFVRFTVNSTIFTKKTHHARDLLSPRKQERGHCPSEKALARLKKRNYDFTSVVEQILQIDADRRRTQNELDSQLAEMNRISKEVGALMLCRGKRMKQMLLKRKQLN